MNPLMIASAGLQFYGAMQASKAAKQEARLQQQQIKEQKANAEIVALQEANARNRNLQDFLNINEALTGVTGRDLNDRSLKALQERAKKETDTASDRARLQFLTEQGQRDLSSYIAGVRGRNRSQSALISGATSLLSAGSKMSSVTPKGGTVDRRFYSGSYGT